MIRPWLFIAPFLIALVVLLVGWRPWKQRDRSALWGGSWATCIALAAAFVATYWLLQGAPQWPTAEKWQRIVWLAGSVGIVAGVSALLMRSSKALVWTVPLALGLVAWLVLTPSHPALWRAVAVLCTLAFWALLEPLAQRGRAVSLPFGLAMTGGATAAVMMLAGQEGYFRLASALAVALAACGLVAIFNRETSLANGPLVVLAATLMPLTILSRVYSHTDVPIDAYVLAPASAAALWAGELPPLNRRPLLRSLVALGATALVCGIALARAANAVDTSIYY